VSARRILGCQVLPDLAKCHVRLLESDARLAEIGKRRIVGGRRLLDRGIRLQDEILEDEVFVTDDVVRKVRDVLGRGWGKCDVEEGRVDSDLVRCLLGGDDVVGELRELVDQRRSRWYVESDHDRIDVDDALVVRNDVLRKLVHVVDRRILFADIAGDLDGMQEAELRACERSRAERLACAHVLAQLGGEVHVDEGQLGTGYRGIVEEMWCRSHTTHHQSPATSVDHPLEELERALPGSAASIASMVAEGEPAPTFTLPSDSGEDVSLESFRGKPVVLYFYPKDDTPGCTAQACGIRDVWGEFERTGAVVLGVSPDKPSEHVKFREKYSLPFPLLSDTEHEVADKYGTWVEKAMYGKTYMGMERSTFVIGADGNVAKIMRNVKPVEHADDVLAALA
jgi:thioredoxin-dependent peroxiredoxin